MKTSSRVIFHERAFLLTAAKDENPHHDTFTCVYALSWRIESRSLTALLVLPSPLL